MHAQASHFMWECAGLCWTTLWWRLQLWGQPAWRSYRNSWKLPCSRRSQMMSKRCLHLSSHLGQQGDIKCVIGHDVVVALLCFVHV